MRLKILNSLTLSISVVLLLTGVAWAIRDDIGYDKGKLNANEVTVDVSNFYKNLNAGDTDVQSALNTIDAMSGGGSMVYPSAGIASSNGTAWSASITDNSANWNTAYGWGNYSADPKHIRFIQTNPAAMYITKHTLCVETVPRNLTITNINMTSDVNPANQTFGEVDYVDACISLANSVFVGSFNTTSGIVNNTVSILVPTGKTLVINTTATPDSNITANMFDITGTY